MLAETVLLPVQLKYQQKQGKTIEILAWTKRASRLSRTSCARCDLSGSDPVSTIIARNVNRLAQAGEHDPTRLRELATEFLRE
jgi:hypothetical protein